MARGPFEGHLMHAQIGTLTVSAGEFRPDIRARGTMNPELVTIGTMLASGREVRQWDYDILPGDVVVLPQAIEQEGRFTSTSRYAAIALSANDLACHFAGEPELEDLNFWSRIGRFRASLSLRSYILQNITKKVAQLQCADAYSSKRSLSALCTRCRASLSRGDKAMPSLSAM
jgi:AraC family ethanolamine operon transcriptional activator